MAQMIPGIIMAMGFYAILRLVPTELTVAAVPVRPRWGAGRATLR